MQMLPQLSILLLRASPVFAQWLALTSADGESAIVTRILGTPDDGGAFITNAHCATGRTISLRFCDRNLVLLSGDWQ